MAHLPISPDHQYGVQELAVARDCHVAAAVEQISEQVADSCEDGQLGCRACPLQSRESNATHLASLTRLHSLVLDDSHALTFQSLGQYRNSLAAAIRQEVNK